MAINNNNEDIVDAMVRIMNGHTGPEPKINQRPAQKRRNCAEEFSARQTANRGELEQSSGNEVDRVHEHNNAFPKLRDELDRRKSITKITTLNSRTLPRDFDPNCSTCVQIAMLKKLKKLHLKTKCTGHHRSHHHSTPYDSGSKDGRSKHYKRSHSNERRSRVAKHTRTNQNSSSSICKLAKNWIDTSCQCSSSVSVKKSRAVVQIQSLAKSSSSGKDVYPDYKLTMLATASDKNNSVHNCSDVSARSASSYHSYMSIGHEPMIME